MATVDVVDWKNKKVGSVDLDPAVFEAPVRDDILHQMVRWQRASARAGTHKVKTRGEVSGGGKKPFKQKGTGNARQGSSRSPLMESGAVIFGPTPRDYSFKIPKKVKKMGLRSALSYLVAESKLVVVEDMKSADGKTKELAGRLKSLGAEKAVLIDAQSDKLFERASQNINKVRYYSIDGLNVFDLLKYDKAVITKDSIEGIVKRCGEGN
ncbi:MAG: 50S ribosomal protein L4 [Bdellovibrionales bacterium]|nr:50S ribosomal protein L4 [Bdellovibrionales bacterium]